MRHLFLMFFTLWVAFATTITIPDSAAALAQRQATATIATFSYLVTTITSTALDENGNPKMRTGYNFVGITRSGQAFSSVPTVEVDATTFVQTTLTSSYNFPSIIPTLYTSYPSTLSSGTNTFRVETRSTVYTAKESTVMNGPLISMTILTTQTATVAKGTTGFTTRTDVLSKPIISTVSVPIRTTTTTDIFTVTMNAAGPIVTTSPSVPASLTPSTFLTQTSSSSSQASTAPSSTSTSTPAPKSSRGKTVIIAVVASILVVIALIGLVYWLWRRKAQKGRKKEVSKPSAVVRMISKPQDAFNPLPHPPPPPPQPIRTDTVTSRQASSDLPSGPYYNAGNERDDSSYVRPRPQSYRPSYQSYTESDFAPPRPPRPETLNTSIREFMGGPSPEPDSNDFQEFLLKSQKDEEEKEEKAAKERRRLMLEEEEIKREQELERARRELSEENLRKRAEDERMREAAEREEQLERARRCQRDMVPAPLNLAKKDQERQSERYHEPEEPYCGSIVSDGNGGLVDIRPYIASEYESIIPNSSGSEHTIEKEGTPSRKEPVSQSPDRREVLSKAADLSPGNRKYDFRDDSDSDEDKKMRERKQLERQILTGDTRESIYSQDTLMGWRTYNRGMNLDRSPESKR